MLNKYHWLCMHACITSIDVYILTDVCMVKLTSVTKCLQVPSGTIKKLTDINWCLTDPANQCLTDINWYYSHTLHIQS